MSKDREITAEYVAELERKLAASEAENLRLEAHLKIVEDLRQSLERMLANARHDKFGAKSEKLNSDQQNLPFEDIEMVKGMLDAATEAAEKVTRKTKPKPAPPKLNKGHLPDHLERIEQIIEPDSTLCPCGCGEMQRVGEDRCDRLDIVPAQLRVLVTIRPKYLCRSCAGQSHAQAPAPEFLISRGLPTEALVAHTMVSKFGDHLPFYRQSEIYRRQGIDLDRTMLGNWSGRGALMLQSIIDGMIQELQRSDHLFADETTIPVMAPGTGKTRKDYLWAVMRDQRGWGGADPPIVVFHHSQSRSGKTAQKIFKDYSCNALTVDGYIGYDILADRKQTNAPMALSYCWTHWRRRFIEFSRKTPSSICEEMLARIAALYQIEAQIRGKNPSERAAVRQKLSKPLVYALRPWLETCLQDLSSASDLTRHIKYGLKRWDGMTRFLSDGQLEMDTNAVENAIRPITLTRKNALFAGSDAGAENWARLASLIGTCKLNGINPQIYIEATLRKILDQHMQDDIQDLMPWNFKT